MPVPIRDLNLDDEGMTCTLSFNRSPFFCIVPWTSVYAVVGCDDGRGMIWPDDVPPEVAQQQARAVETPERRDAPRGVPAPERAAAEAPKAKRPRKRPVSATQSPLLRARGAETGRRKRELPPYLRVVK